ncbi:hypothetical protein [Streptomyces luteireticuli]|uniref:hypothetical protein n=1 Tax=Streptomyces luteireticuli TaxID=173858 RepID=UPI0035577FCF
MTFNPYGPDAWDQEEEQHAAYTATLRKAGWCNTLDLGRLVLVPGVPTTSSHAPFTATWSIAIDDASSPQQAAEHARERQIDTGITEALWEVRDAVGRTHTVFTADPDLA